MDPLTPVIVAPPHSVRWFAPWTWRRRWQVAVGLATLLMAYVLSLGPAIGLAGRGGLSPGHVAYAYRPLLIVQARLPRPVRNAVERYLRSWGSRTYDTVQWHHLLWDLQALQSTTPGSALFSELDQEETLLLPAEISDATD